MSNIFIHNHVDQPFNNSYDQHLVLEIWEFFTKRCWNYTQRTDTLLLYLPYVVKHIMQAPSGGYPRIDRYRMSRRSAAAKFFLAAFPEDHRMWNYLHIDNSGRNDHE